MSHSVWRTRWTVHLRVPRGARPDSEHFSIPPLTVWQKASSLARSVTRSPSVGSSGLLPPVSLHCLHHFWCPTPEHALRASESTPTRVGSWADRNDWC